MVKLKKQESKNCKSKRHWRKNQKFWTDTCFGKKLLTNPSLMTNVEISRALTEYNEWRCGKGKYALGGDGCSMEDIEFDPPFSPQVLSCIITEASVRLKISGELSLGRFKFEKVKG